MNNIVFLIVFVLMTTLAKANDINLYSNTNSSWNSFLIEELEQILMNVGSDVKVKQFQYKDEDIVYDSSSIEDLLTPEVNDFLTHIENISGLGILKVKPEFVIEDIGYEFFDIIPDIKVKSVESGVKLDTKLKINGVHVFANSFNINFVLPRLVKSRKVVAFQVKLKDPLINFNRGVTLPLDLGIQLQKNNNGISLQIPHLNVEEFTKVLNDSFDQFDFDFKDLEISDVQLEIMGRMISIDDEQIKMTIMENKEELKKIILEQLSSLLLRDGIKAILRSKGSDTFNSKYWFNTEDSDYPLMLDISEIKKFKDNVVQVGLNGGFCTRENFVKFSKDCEGHKTLPQEENTISESDNKESSYLIQKEFLLPDTKFIASISENYFTKLIHGTIENKEWNELLDEYDIKFGPRKAFIKFDERGDSATVYIDTVYKLKGLKQWVLSKNEINFPIVLKVRPRVEYQMGYLDEEGQAGEKQLLPYIIFNIRDIVLEDDILWKGIPELGMKSTIPYVTYGFRNLVLRKVKSELFDFDEPTKTYKKDKWLGTDLPPLLVPLINKLKLEKLQFKSDGFGRGNFKLNGSDVLHQSLN